MLLARHDNLLMRPPSRKRSNAKDKRNDRTYPEIPPLLSVNEIRRMQSGSFKSQKGIDPHQTVADEH
jgi:hypothetical protein